MFFFEITEIKFNYDLSEDGSGNHKSYTWRHKSEYKSRITYYNHAGQLMCNCKFWSHHQLICVHILILHNSTPIEDPIEENNSKTHFVTFIGQLLFQRFIARAQNVPDKEFDRMMSLFAQLTEASEQNDLDGFEAKLRSNKDSNSSNSPNTSLSLKFSKLSVSKFFIFIKKKCCANITYHILIYRITILRV